MAHPARGPRVRIGAPARELCEVLAYRGVLAAETWGKDAGECERELRAWDLRRLGEKGTSCLDEPSDTFEKRNDTERKHENKRGDGRGSLEG